MSGILHIVSMPIGDPGDITVRALRLLHEADFIICERYDASSELLRALSLDKPLVFHLDTPVIIDKLKAGAHACLICDAGTPLLADPGLRLVRMCAAENIEVKAAPGASAILCALTLSGLCAGRFCFEGFLSMNRRSRFTHLAEIASEPRTMVFFEAPRKLKATLQDLHHILGDRKIAICRDMTKPTEHIEKTTLADAAQRYAVRAEKGEYVLVIEGQEGR